MKAPWKRTVVLFAGSQTFSLFGSMLVQYAISWYITLETQSGAMMTIAILCGMIPTFLISPFGGVWADRFDRKKLIMLADSGIAFATLAVAVLFIAGYREYWLLFSVLIVRSLGQGVQSPAVSAYLPSIVPEERLMKVNGLMGTVQSVTMLIAPMASAALLSLLPIEKVFFVDIVTAVLAVSILGIFIKTPATAAQEQKKLDYFSDLLEGLRYISKHRYIKRFFAFTAVFFFLCSPVAFLTPLQVTRSFGADVWRLTAIEVAFSLGMAIGGILISSWGGLRNRVHSMVLSGILMGVFTVALGILPWFAPYLVFMALFGVVMPLFNTPAVVLLQEKVENEFLGRVFSVMTMISTLTMPAGMLLFGPLADTIKIEFMLIGTGIGLSGAAILLLASRTLVRAGEPEIKEGSV